MPRRALVVGRFQPPHRGHLHCLEEAVRLADETIVVVGSAQRSHTLADPFTAGERVEMLHLMAQDAQLDLHFILPVPDLGQYHLWVAHVTANVPAFDVVVAGNPLTLQLFQAAGHAVHPVALRERGRWSGTEMRRRLIAGAPIEDGVTPGVARFLGRQAFEERFAALRATNEQGAG